MHDTKFTDFPRQHKLPHSSACQDHISYSANSQAQRKVSATQPSSRNNYWAQNTLSIKPATLSSTSSYAWKTSLPLPMLRKTSLPLPISSVYISTLISSVDPFSFSHPPTVHSSCSSSQTFITAPNQFCP